MPNKKRSTLAERLAKAVRNAHEVERQLPRMFVYMSPEQIAELRDTFGYVPDYVRPTAKLPT